MAPVAGAMCNRAKKSPDAPRVHKALTSRANTEIDLRGCRIGTENYSTVIRKEAAKLSGVELISTNFIVALTGVGGTKLSDHDGVPCVDALSNAGTGEAKLAPAKCGP